ncbi:MAG: diguanylate cyclase, partial [Desulfuromonadaceae bacterium]
QLATLYFGQLLHEPPDLKFFLKLARECGFEEEAYLAAIRRVPVIPEERIESIMTFYVELAQMLARSGLDRLRQREAEQRLTELNRELVQRVEERTAELALKNQHLNLEVEERKRTEDALRGSQTRLQVILDSFPVGIGWADADGKVRYVNRKFTELFGYALEDIPTIADWCRLAYPDAVSQKNGAVSWTCEAEAARAAGREDFLLEMSVVCKDAGSRHVLIGESRVGDQQLANFSDISDRWRAEQRNRARNATLERIARGAALPQVLNAIAREIEAENDRALCSILLLDAGGEHLRIGAAPSLPDFFNAAMDGLAVGEGVGACGTAAAAKKRLVVEDIQNHPVWETFRDLADRAGLAACWSEPIFSSLGRMLGLFAIYHPEPRVPDAAALELIGWAANLAGIAIECTRANEELEHRAHTDFLTQLANRRYFLELAENELRRALRFRKEVALRMLDIDHFKPINDSYGHKICDLVLHTVAKTLRQTLRRIDVVGRFGGEEFAVVLPETGGQAALETAERLRLAIAAAETTLEDEGALRVSVSIGGAVFSEGANDVETLLKRADEALYVAKRGGRNQVRMAEPSPGLGESEVAADFVKWTWHTAYESGHALIDTQHRMLFRHVDDLFVAVLSNHSKERVRWVIKEMLADVGQHFASEEVVMAESGFPGVSEHAENHRQLLEKAQELVQLFDADNLGVGELFQFLAHELIAGHMLREDRKFFPFLPPGATTAKPVFSA